MNFLNLEVFIGKPTASSFALKTRSCPPLNEPSSIAFNWTWTEWANCLYAEVKTYSPSPFWSTSTPITSPLFCWAAALIEAKIPPPHEKIISVPDLYQEAASVWIAGSGIKESVYLYCNSILIPNSFAASFAPWT